MVEQTAIVLRNASLPVSVDSNTKLLRQDLEIDMHLASDSSLLRHFRPTLNSAANQRAR